MRVLARRNGLFGLIRVIEHKNGARLYCIEESLQTMVRPDGVSLFGYVHAAKLLMRSAKTILLIGGAGGSLATMLARRGRQVTVIDIDPPAEELARTYFGLDECVHWATAEPLSFICRSSAIYDAVVIDACDANGLIGPFRDPCTLSDIAMRACPNGSLIVNLVDEEECLPRSGHTLVQELTARGFSATLFSAENVYDGNCLLHIRAQGETGALNVTNIDRRPAETHRYLRALRPTESTHCFAGKA